MRIPFFRQHKAIEDASISYGQTASLLTAKAYPSLENSAFWNCITKLCRQYASMPVHAYKSDGRFRQRLYNGAVAYILKHPCSYMGSSQWRFIMGFNFEMHGVALAVIESKGSVITNLFPVSPKLLTPFWENNKLFWRYSKTGEVFPDEKILRIMNTPIGFADVLSPVDYAQSDLEVASNSKTLQSNYYKNGASIGGILSVPKGTSKEAKEQIKSMLISSYSGATNANKTLIIEDSMKYEPIHLEDGDITKIMSSQAFTVDEVARRFGVPPLFCGDLSKATYGNAEQQGMDLVIYALQPRFVAWEDALNNLLGDENVYIKFNLNGLMRGDHAARSAFYHNGIMDGWLSVNDVREFEDMNPIEGGDSHYFPLNYGKINPDGSIDNPNANQGLSFNPFDLPTDKHEKKEQVIEDRKQKDLAYLAEAQNVTKTNRQKIESIMRRQIKACSDKLNALKNKNYDLSTIQSEFTTFCQSIEVTYGNEYVEVFKNVMARLAPIVQKQIGSKQELDQNALDSYAGKIGQSMSGRFSTNRANEVNSCEVYENLDDVQDKWFEVPKEESEDETNRAGNAFQVFLYGQLGLEYMHVVAAPDACEFCQQLDGKVVEVNGNILSKGDEGTDGAGNIRTIHKNYKHPPFHKFCHCGIAPGKGV